MRARLLAEPGSHAWVLVRLAPRLAPLLWRADKGRDEPAEVLEVTANNLSAQQTRELVADVWVGAPGGGMNDHVSKPIDVERLFETTLDRLAR